MQTIAIEFDQQELVTTIAAVETVIERCGLGLTEDDPVLSQRLLRVRHRLREYMLRRSRET